MIVLLLSLFLITAVAALVLVAVAFPYRGRSTERAPWLGEALGRLLRRVQPTDPPPDQPLLVDPERDARMRARFERVEQGIVGGVRKATGRDASA